MILLILWAVLASGCFVYGLLFYKLLLRWRVISDSEEVRGSDLVLVGLCLLVMLCNWLRFSCRPIIIWRWGGWPEPF